MIIQIEIIDVSILTKPNKAGTKTYQQAEVAYKDLAKGSVGGKKIMDFAHPTVFATVIQATRGELYDVEMTKGAEYWEWIKLTKVNGNSPVSKAVLTSKPTTPSPTPKSTYETPEERARRQVLIVRQSSLSTAVEYFKGRDIKGIVAVPGEVLSLAAMFETYVFEGLTSTNTIESLTNDIPD